MITSGVESEGRSLSNIENKDSENEVKPCFTNCLMSGSEFVISLGVSSVSKESRLSGVECDWQSSSNVKSEESDGAWSILSGKRSVYDLLGKLFELELTRFLVGVEPLCIVGDWHKFTWEGEESSVWTYFMAEDEDVWFGDNCVDTDFRQVEFGVLLRSPDDGCCNGTVCGLDASDDTGLEVDRILVTPYSMLKSIRDKGTVDRTSESIRLWTEISEIASRRNALQS